MPTVKHAVMLAFRCLKIHSLVGTLSPLDISLSPPFTRAPTYYTCLRILFSSSLCDRGRALWFEVIYSEGSFLHSNPPRLHSFCIPLAPLPLPVSLLFPCQLGVAEGMEAQKNAQQMKWMMRVMAVGMVPLSATFPKVCGRMATYVSRFAVRLVSRFAGQSARR